MFDLYALQAAFGLLLLQLLHTLMTIFTTRQVQQQELYNLYKVEVGRGRKRSEKGESAALLYTVHRCEKAICVALCVHLPGL